jgi:hypothetical protein
MRPWQGEQTLKQASDEELVVFNIELVYEAQLKMVAVGAGIAARLAPCQVFSRTSTASAWLHPAIVTKYQYLHSCMPP